MTANDMTLIYERLTTEFAETQKLKKADTYLDYLSGEQVITRLNETLGLDGWNFEIKEHGQNAAGFWVLGCMTVFLDRGSIKRDQFGECGTNRGMGEGDALKGAATDCLKKCASLFGVGLYLSHKEGVKVETSQETRTAPRETAPAPFGGTGSGQSRNATTSAASPPGGTASRAANTPAASGAASSSTFTESDTTAPDGNGSDDPRTAEIERQRAAIDWALGQAAPPLREMAQGYGVVFAEAAAGGLPLPPLPGRPTIADFQVHGKTLKTAVLAAREPVTA